MSKFKITAESQGIKEMMVDFDKLTASEQKFIQQTFLANQQVKKLGDNSKGMKMLQGAVKDVATSFAGMIGANGVAQIFGTIIEKARENMKQIIDMQNRAAKGQRQVGDSLKGLIANDKDLSKDEKKVKSFLDFSATQGVKLGEGGQAQVLDALKDLRSSTSGTDEQRLAALEQATNLKQFDPNTDLSSAAKTIFNLAREMERSNSKELKGKDSNVVAVNFAKTLGAQFVGDASNAFKEVTGLINKGTLGVNTSEASALFAFTSKAIDDTKGDQSGTVSGELLNKVLQADGKEVNGKNLKFKSDNAFERIIEFADRLKSGEFGNTNADKAKAIKSVFGESSSAISTILALSKDGETKQLRSNVESFKDSFSGEDIIKRDTNLVNKYLGIKEQKNTDKLKAQADLALNSDTEAAKYAEKAEQLKAIQATLKITDGFDFLKDTKETLARAGSKTPEKFFADELDNLFAKGGIQTNKVENDISEYGSSLGEDTETGKAIKANKSMKEIALAAILSGQVNLGDGDSASENALLIWSEINTTLLNQLKEQKASSEAIIAALKSQKPATIGAQD